MLRKLRFISSICGLYVLSIGTIGGLLYSSHLLETPAWAKPKPQIIVATPKPLPPKVIAGKPTRVVIEQSNINLAVDEGQYDPATQTWTLSDTNAMYATMTSLANDHAGTTFIYGHGTDAVFGKIGTAHPPEGTKAVVHTDSGRVFMYELQTVRDFQPEDTSLFDDTTSGEPRLIIQTCTGIFSEWRTMFIFRFKEVQ